MQQCAHNFYRDSNYSCHVCPSNAQCLGATAIPNDGFFLATQSDGSLMAIACLPEFCTSSGAECQAASLNSHGASNCCAANRVNSSALCADCAYPLQPWFNACVSTFARPLVSSHLRQRVLPFAACDSTDYGLIVGWLVLCFVMAGAFSVVAKPPMQAIDYSADADVIEIESQSTDSRVFVRFAGLPLLRCNLSCSSTKFSKSSLRSANHDSVPRRRDADIDGAQIGRAHV